MALVDGKPELLSTFQYIYDALGISDEESLLERNHSLEMVAEFCQDRGSTQFVCGHLLNSILRNRLNPIDGSATQNFPLMVIKS